jgi:hypothetical protein
MSLDGTSPAPDATVGRRGFIGALPGLAAHAELPAGSQGLVQGAWVGAVTPRGG